MQKPHDKTDPTGVQPGAAETESLEHAAAADKCSAATDRLWWLRKAIGYDEAAPGAFYPHLILADGSLFGSGIRWRAGTECAHLTGWHAACELEGFGEHMFHVNNARDDHRDYPPPEFTVLPPGRWRDPMRSRPIRLMTEKLKRDCYCCNSPFSQ